MYLIKGLLLAFLAFQFFSCENEPLTGEFPEDDQNEAEDGEFIATIDGEEFIANLASATINSDNELVIVGEKAGGENITLGITNAAVGTFNLATNETNENAGAYFDGSTNVVPYVTAETFGGSGQLKITELNTEEQTVTGTFSFIGVRVKLDDDGNPVLDGSGNPVMEEVGITSGAFNSVSYVFDDTGGGTGGTNDEFFAKVDGVDFIAESILVSEPIVGDIHMIKVIANSAAGELIRIDVPRSLGVGTFEMVRISDGTELIAVYNAGDGNENLTSDPGTITITEFDLEAGVLKATFNFTATDPLNQRPDVVEVTEGNLTAYFEGVPGANNQFSANVDDVPYIPEEINIEVAPVNQYPRLTITTTKEDQKMELSFPLTVTEGAYDMEAEVIDGDEVVGIYTPVVGTSIPYVSETGSLVITNYDMENGIIEGSFNFTGKDVAGQDPTIYQVTGGTFLIVLP